MKISKTALRAILRLLVVSATMEHRLDQTLTSAHGISLQELILLLNLERSPLHRLRRTDLASAMSIGASSITHLGDPLEKEGLVQREFDARDRRVSYMALTVAGAKRVTEAMTSLAELAPRLFDERWTDKDIHSFDTRLGQLVYGSTSNVVD